MLTCKMARPERVCVGVAQLRSSRLIGAAAATFRSAAMPRNACESAGGLKAVLPQR